MVLKVVILHSLPALGMIVAYVPRGGFKNIETPLFSGVLYRNIFAGASNGFGAVLPNLSVTIRFR